VYLSFPFLSFLFISFFLSPTAKTAIFVTYIPQTTRIHPMMCSVPFWSFGDKNFSGIKTPKNLEKVGVVRYEFVVIHSRKVMVH